MLNRSLLFGLAAFKLGFHLLLANRYGYFRDELYFLDCGRHLAFGYVDHAPFIGLVSRAALTLGGSLLALRIFPALAGAMLVALAMLIVPQHFGDRFGWPELVAEVARIYHALPPRDRARATIFANNYGEAGAVNLFGPRHALPPAVSAHQTHFLWGPRGNTGEVLIVLQDDRQTLEKICASVEEAGQHAHPWGMAEENGPIFVCRGLKPPLPELWPQLKKWN